MGLYRVKCDGCNFEQLLSELPRSYRLPNDVVIHVETGWAWCATCQNVTQSEEIRPLEDIQRELDAAIAREPEIVDWVREIISPSEDFEAAYQRTLARFAQRRDWRQSRQSPPRCLECGATAITPFVWHEADNPDDDHFVPVSHPGCNGLLHLSLAGLNRPAIQFFYNSEGVQV
jgi:hypothetical protein